MSLVCDRRRACRGKRQGVLLGGTIRLDSGSAAGSAALVGAPADRHLPRLCAPKVSWAWNVFREGAEHCTRGACAPVKSEFPSTRFNVTNTGGALYRVRLEIQGKAEHLADLK
jgi:hypothetical protein